MTADPLVADLDGLLETLQEQYRTLQRVGRERREAIRRADPEGVAACIGIENQAVQAIAEVEKRRITVVGLLAQRFAIPEKSQARLTAIAAALGGTVGERLAKRAQELRELLEAVRKENEVVRMAAEQLSRHMEGLWKQACGVLSHARTYGRQGSVDPGPSIVSALDLRS